jgi:hypothetical protein
MRQVQPIVNTLATASNAELVRSPNAHHLVAATSKFVRHCLNRHAKALSLKRSHHPVGQWRQRRPQSQQRDDPNLAGNTAHRRSHRSRQTRGSCPSVHGREHRFRPARDRCRLLVARSPQNRGARKTEVHDSVGTYAAEAVSRRSGLVRLPEEAGTIRGRGFETAAAPPARSLGRGQRESTKTPWLPVHRSTRQPEKEGSRPSRRSGRREWTRSTHQTAATKLLGTLPGRAKVAMARPQQSPRARSHLSSRGPQDRARFAIQQPRE